MSEFDLSNFRAICFDFDGTLANSNGVHTESRLEAYEAVAAFSGDERYMQVPIDIHDNAHLLSGGTHSAEINAWILAAVGIIDDAKDLDDPRVQAIVEFKNAIYHQKIKDGLDEQAGAVQFVRSSAVRRPGMLAIASTAYRAEVIPYLRRYKLDRYFPDSKLILNGHPEVMNLKPAPDAYSIATEHLGVKDPADVLVIEDSQEGAQAARRAGNTVIGLELTRDIDAFMGAPEEYRPHAVYLDFNQLSVVTGIKKAA